MILDKLAQAILDLNLVTAKEVVETAVKANIPANKIVQNGIGHDAEPVSRQYEAKEYFLPELIMTGEAMKVFLDTQNQK